jgi:hypothetical protein
MNVPACAGTRASTFFTRRPPKRPPSERPHFFFAAFFFAAFFFAFAMLALHTV